MTGTEEFALSIELSTREAAPLSEVALSDIGIKERADLQRWVEAYSEMIGPDLLLITTEFDPVGAAPAEGGRPARCALPRF